MSFRHPVIFWGVLRYLDRVSSGAFWLISTKIVQLAPTNFSESSWQIKANFCVGKGELCPPHPSNQRDEGHIGCGVDLFRVASFFCGRYLLNQWTDFVKTCTDILFGGCKELIKLW